MNDIEKIYKSIAEISKDYLQFGITNLVKEWLQKVEDWAEKEENAEILSVIYGFQVWNDKDELKKLTIKVIEKYQTYLLNKNTKNKVFIAHNDKDPTATELCTLLISKKYHPIIMQLEPSVGGTIFDKFKSIKFDIAVAVLTEDRKFKKKTNISRVKQNVILEIGYAYAYLKEIRRIIILYDGKVEIPSNIGAVEYIKIDKDWKHNLTNSLKARRLIIEEERI